MPLNAKLEDLQAKALATRPDLRAAQQGVTAANSQYDLAKANGKRDVTGQINYTHVADLNTASLFGQIQLPIFDRNQGEIARTQVAITQAQEQEKAASEQVLTDVEDAYEGLHTNDEIIQLYRSGYLDEAQQDRDISQYAYQARRREPAGFSRCRAQLSRNAACLSPIARGLSARARTASRGRGNEEPAMRFRMNAQRTIRAWNRRGARRPPSCWLDAARARAAQAK